MCVGGGWGGQVEVGQFACHDLSVRPLVDVGYYTGNKLTLGTPAGGAPSHVTALGASE